MAWIPIYAAETDLRLLLSFLNASDEIAFVVSDGPGKWIAVKSLSALPNGRYCLWHVPSGALPLIRGVNDAPGEIRDPFDGWTEARAGADRTQPYFGPGHPGVFWLNVRSTQTNPTGIPVVGLSSFEWIGNHYKSIGFQPKPETERFWKHLYRWVRKSAVQVPRGGPRQMTPPAIWALPGAQAMFQAGAEGGNN